MPIVAPARDDPPGLIRLYGQNRRFGWVRKVGEDYELAIYSGHRWLTAVVRMRDFQARALREALSKLLAEDEARKETA